MMYGWGAMGGWGAALMVLQSVALWALVLIAGAGLWRLVVDAGTGSGRLAAPGARATPQEVLADRFARGEIEEDEYRRRAALLDERSVQST